MFDRLFYSLLQRERNDLVVESVGIVWLYLQRCIEGLYGLLIILQAAGIGIS
jgi:hypothetical protein